MAITNEAEFLTKLKSVVTDSAGKKTDDEKKEWLQEAVLQYSRDKPLIRDAIITGDGALFEHPTPSDWVDQFSFIRQVEYPLLQNPPRIFRHKDDDIEVLQRSNVEKVILKFLQLGNGEQLRIFYQIPHTLTDTSTSIPINDTHAVVNYAGHLLALGLANHYAEALDSSLSAQSSDRLRTAEIFALQSKDLLDLYTNHTNQGETLKAAGMSKDFDVRPITGRADFTFHSRFRR